MEYETSYSYLFREHFNKMTDDEQRLITRKIDLLKANPDHRSLRTKVLRLKKGVKYESSVSMDIRLIWQFDGDQIVLGDVGHHDMLKNKKLRRR
jgi:mRNA interferase RelE/StbE